MVLRSAGVQLSRSLRVQRLRSARGSIDDFGGASCVLGGIARSGVLQPERRLYGELSLLIGVHGVDAEEFTSGLVPLRPLLFLQGLRWLLPFCRLGGVLSPPELVGSSPKNCRHAERIAGLRLRLRRSTLVRLYSRRPPCNPIGESMAGGQRAILGLNLAQRSVACCLCVDFLLRVWLRHLTFMCHVALALGERLPARCSLELPRLV